MVDKVNTQVPSEEQKQYADMYLRNMEFLANGITNIYNNSKSSFFTKDSINDILTKLEQDVDDFQSKLADTPQLSESYDLVYPDFSTVEKISEAIKLFSQDKEESHNIANKILNEITQYPHAVRESFPLRVFPH